MKILLYFPDPNKARKGKIRITLDKSRTSWSYAMGSLPNPLLTVGSCTKWPSAHIFSCCQPPQSKSSLLVVLFWNKKSLNKCNRGHIGKGHKKGFIWSFQHFPVVLRLSTAQFLVEFLWCKNTERTRKEDKCFLYLFCFSFLFFIFNLSELLSYAKKNLQLTCKIPKTSKTGTCELPKGAAFSFPSLSSATLACWTQAPSTRTEVRFADWLNFAKIGSPQLKCKFF